MNQGARTLDKPQKAMYSFKQIFSLKLKISTWAKDSHGLYDYESPLDNYRIQSHSINISTILYKDGQAPRTLLINKDNTRQPRQSFYPIANIIVDKKQSTSDNNTVAKFQAIQRPGQNNQANFDSTKIFYKVIREASQGNNSKGYPLKPGDIVKMGRVQYIVIEMRNNSETSTIRSTNHFSQNNVIFQYKKQQQQKIIDQDDNQIRCKVCLCNQQTQQDPLISPCKCKGTVKKIHVGCLRQWINSKVKKQINDIATSYNFTKFQCQICKCPFPKIVQMNDKKIQMMTIHKPNKPYIMLESLNRNSQQGPKQQKCLHLISAKQSSSIKIGRAHTSQIRLTDISVSRSHAQIIFANDQFFIKDTKSKFGTLIKFDGTHVFQAGKVFKVQYGRTLFQFQMNATQQSDTQQEASINSVNQNQLPIIDVPQN